MRVIGIDMCVFEAAIKGALRAAYKMDFGQRISLYVDPLGHIYNSKHQNTIELPVSIIAWNLDFNIHVAFQDVKHHYDNIEEYEREERNDYINDILMESSWWDAEIDEYNENQSSKTGYLIELV